MVTASRPIRAAIFPAPHAAVEVRAIPEPELEPGGARLQVELSEVCGTDVHLAAGRLQGVPYPIIPGHVTVGRLAALRGAWRDVQGRRLAEGDRVTFLDVHGTCHACWFCLVAKATTRCPERKVYGITYGLADGLCGGWAEVVHLKPGVHCLRLAETVAPATFMAGGCALPTAIHALERGELRLGETVLVLGTGPVGLSAMILAKLGGAGRVLAIGAPESRRAAALAVGADRVLALEAHSPAERAAWVLAESDGRGADLTIEATGSPQAVVEAMRMTRDAGRVVIAGQYTDGGDVTFNPHRDLNRKHLDLRGCWGSDFSHFQRAVDLLHDPARAELWSRLPVARFGLGAAAQALAAVAEGAVVKALIDPAAA
ncbi:MAG TPA: zinc-binding dehydrogenase [Candidatus Udaeobacter sp.]|nr:zinc-binding dehydrogenase [Candidatus Udaeobacter sp.]